MDRTNLAGQTILVVEEQALIALDLQLEQAAPKCASRAMAPKRWPVSANAISRRGLSIGVLSQTIIARALKQDGVRFLFYATHPPEDVSTARGAPVFLKPERPEKIVAALALLVGAK